MFSHLTCTSVISTQGSSLIRGALCALLSTAVLLFPRQKHAEEQARSERSVKSAVAVPLAHRGVGVLMFVLPTGTSDPSVLDS